MFGITLGAALVSKHKNFFTHERTSEHLSQFALAFGVSSLLALALHIHLPLTTGAIFTGTIILILTVVALTTTFTLGGICICLCLTRFSSIVGKLYCADLVGSALGALSLLFIFAYLNGPAAILVVLFAAIVAALFFYESGKNKAYLAFSYSLLALTIGVLSTELTDPTRSSFFQIRWVKGEIEKPLLFERWNSFSRITVKDMEHIPFGWGLSSQYPKEAKVDQKYLEIDAGASTPITRFDGSFENLGHLKADVVNLVHYLRASAEVFVVGVGGGRDILTALTFGQKNIVGAEINKDIITAVREKFGEYDGHLLDLPNVEVINDEARSYISRQSKEFDIVQISLVDTAAAHSTGAFVLSENSLYTAEALEQFIKHLKPNGLISVSRWWSPTNPSEAYRTLALIREGLLRNGVQHPEKNILAIVNNHPMYSAPGVDGVITVIGGRSEFKSEDIKILESITSKFDFQIMLNPLGESDPIFNRVSREPSEELSRELSLRIEAPTDNAPFFFFFSKFKDLFGSDVADPNSLKLSKILLVLLLALISLSYVFLIKPAKASLEGNADKLFAVYFGAIGSAYMLVEMSFMLWFSSFLGHPNYSISIVLFTLLLATGIGSFATEKIGQPRSRISLVGGLILLVTIGIFYPQLSSMFRESPISSRICLTIALIFPLGFCMGLFFPTGLKLAGILENKNLSLFWGINGAASVSAGVVALIISIYSTVQITFWCGAICYLIAVISYSWLSRK